MSNNPQVFGALPVGRRLDEDSPHPEGYIGAIGSLRPYDPELGKLLRRRIREIRDRDLTQDGKTFIDGKTDEAFTLVTSYVDPLSPEDSLVSAFCVRDNMICYLRSVDAVEEVKVVHVGVMSGRRVS